MKCTAFRRCDQPARYLMEFHGCDRLYACPEHSAKMMSWIKEAEIQYCDDCRQTFTSLEKFIETRFVRGF